MDGATRGFGAMCSGEAQGLLDRRQMPRSSIVWKWDFAKVSLSGCILCALERIGAQVVGMKCCTPCLTVGQLKLGVVIVGNSTRRRPNLSSAEAMVSREAWTARRAREQRRRRTEERVSELMRRRPRTSTRRPVW